MYPHGPHRARGRRQYQQQGVDRVEHRLLVLLQVTVIRQRQPLEHDEQSGERADQPAGLAPRELGDIRVLLLRHDRTTGGERVVQLDPTELPARPQNDLLAEPGQVHTDQRGREQELRDEITVGDRVDRVREGRVETELPRDAVRVERERGTGQRARAQTAHGGTPVPVP